MKNFCLKHISNSEYKYLIIATTYISPTENLSEIESNITGFTGKVIFDQTLINGNSFNRYIEAIVEDGKFNRRSFKAKKDIDIKIKQISKDFFLKNKVLVDSGTITKAIKFLVSSGQIV